MPTPLHLLLVEDNPQDAELVLRELRRAGFELDWRRVDTEAAYSEQLHPGLDLVISDFAMPEFSGLRALELLRQRRLEIPFILVSGTIGEETAVTAMKQGAADYLLKDRLARLGPAVHQALEQGRFRRERARSETMLAESERRYREMLENLELIAMTLDQQGVVTFCNDFLLRLTGWKREEVIGHLWFDRFLPDSAAAVKQLFLDTVGVGKIPPHHQNPIKTRAGDLREIAWNNTMLQDSAGNITGTASIGEDVTERMRAEAALRESEERFRQLAENINEVFWMTDPAKNTMLYISPAYATIWGRTCESLYATPLNWVEALHPDDRQRVLEAARTKQSRGDYDEIYRIVRPDGTLRWIHDKAFRVMGGNGKVHRIVGVAQDITEQKKLEEQFLHAQRMEAIGTLASGVAHDLNNILAPMLMGAALLKEKTTSVKEREMLSMIERSGQRGAGIIRQLLSFSRVGSGERIMVQPKHLIRDMVEIMHETFPRNIAIIDPNTTGLWTIEADPTQLHQVIMNLCVNARDAMPAGGTLTLETVNTTVGQDTTGDPALKPGAYLLLTVKDTGHGIPPEIINRIFEPFFTTKEVGKGTGLGLSTVMSIIKGHGGVVKVDSEPGRGTAFRVYFPASGEKDGAKAAESSAPMPRGRGEMILVVDDEAPIRDATRGVLEANGYRVLLARSGEEALTIIIENLGALRLVLTDMMMPGMDGLALIRSLRILETDIQVIATSGLAQERNRAELATLGVTEVLAKPYAPELLLKAIDTVLAR